MSMSTKVDDDPPSLANDWRWSLAKRVSDGPQFRKSPRLREFLLFVCDRALQDRQNELREQQIGCNVFRRRPEYNPSEDNIVRVEARKVRIRLEEYFASEGRTEPVLIEIPKGSYVPIFTPRIVEPLAIASPTALAPTVPPPEIVTPRRVHWVLVQPVLIILLALTSLWMWNRDLVRRTQAKDAPSPVAKDVLWSSLFNDQHETTIVCADSTLVLLENFIRRPISLEDYLSPAYPSLLASLKAFDGSALPLKNKQYTSMADVHLVATITQLNQPFWRRTSVRSARMMQLPDFKNGNFVLLGSNRAIPWVELFEPRLNFLFEFDETRRVAVIRNRSPRAGERSQYVNGIVGEPGDAFSFVAFVPNLTYTGYVLIIAGNSMEATEAAGEYMTNATFSSNLLKVLGFRPKSKPRSFEVLLRSSTMAGSWKDSEIVAYRVGREYETHP
jgi:hypothetical protein